MPSYYSFLPYIRQGLAGLITQADSYGTPTAAPTNYNERATIPLSIPLNKTDINGNLVSPTPSISKTVLLKGPGDIVGINSSAIVKVSPADWVTNMEPNYLPYIEFYDEDFPWRYTPAAAAAENIGQNKFRLRPWIALVVLEESEFTIDTFNGIAPTITIKAPSETLPKTTDMWAWAHVHVNDDIGTNNSTTIDTAAGILKNKLDSNPDIAVSRLICPRKLKPDTAYYAFVIPTFETGRLAGTGNTNDIATTYALKPSWITGSGGTPANTQYPVYHQWFFKTGNAGDFESLVRLLQPRVLGSNVGKRATDLQRSGNSQLETVNLAGNGIEPLINLEGVLKPQNTTPDAWSLDNVYAAKIKEIVNKPANLLAQSGGDPIIAPPIYGKWHAAVTKLDETTTTPTNWIHEANLDPRFRLFAGIGAEVVRKNQDQYMQAAWEQVGEVMEANRRLRQMQLAKQASVALHEKHLKPLAEELLLNVSGPVHTRIKIPSNTVYQAISESILSNDMFTGAFRRLTRPNGPLMRSIDNSGALTTQSLIQGINSSAVQAFGPYQVPSQLGSYNIWSAFGVNPIDPNFLLTMNQVNNFVFTAPGGSFGTPIGGSNSTSAQIFVGAATNLNNILIAVPSYQFITLPALAVSPTVTSIIARTDPKETVFDLAKRSIRLTAANGTAAPDITSLDVILASPKIRVPMYAPLAQQSPDWMMPGLNTIEHNSVNLLMADQKYIEAYMLGANYEMARELLWRGYPTDQRGTCFSFFWGYNSSTITFDAYNMPELDNFRDIKDIHTWKTSNVLTNLGVNSGRTSNGVPPSMLVLTIRGELLRKYPGTMIYLQKAKWNTQNGQPTDIGHRNIATDSNGEVAPVYPVFSAHVEPDIYFLGFAGVDAATVRGQAFHPNPNNTSIIGDPGYFFVFQERAGELHFGADVYDPNETYGIVIDKWDDVNWANITSNPGNITTPQFVEPTKTMNVGTNPDNVTWNQNAASIAYALHQSPVKLQVHASSLVQAP